MDEAGLEIVGESEPGEEALGSGEPVGARGRRRWFAAAAILLAGILALALAELIMRVFNPVGVKQRASWHFLLVEGLRKSANPEKVWEHVPGYRRKLIGYRVAINSLGFRGEEIATIKPADCFRILALGDSMTFGMSGDQDDCYPAQLQAMLRKAFPNRRIEVINAGVLGYTTLQEEALLSEALPALKPDAVVLWWCHNDTMLTGAANPADQNAELANLLGLRPRTWKRTALHWTYEVLPCTMALLRAVTVGRRDGDATHFAFDPKSNPEGWAANSASLERMIEFCRRNQAPMIIYTFGRYEAVEEICRRAKVRYVTTVERAGREHEEQYAVSRVDPHFNRAGNAATAQTLFECIRSLM